MRAALFFQFASALLLASCSTAPVKTISPTASKALLFPLGNYRHQVRLEIPKTQTSEEKVFNFDGAVVIQEDLIKVAVLTHLGLTAFRITDSLKTGEIKTEIFIDSMKKHEPKVKEYYSVLRELLMSPSQKNRSNRLTWKKSDSRGLPLELETTGLDKNARFVLESYDKSGVPERVLIEHPHFQVRIQVVGYEI